MYVDAVGQFTYWSKRTFAYDSNSGLRLDYFVCTNDLARNSAIAITGTTSSSSSSSSGSSDEKGPYIKDYYSRHDHSIVKCSDHCPIVLIVKV